VVRQWSVFLYFPMYSLLWRRTLRTCQHDTAQHITQHDIANTDMRNIIIESYTPHSLTHNKIHALARARTSPETLPSPRRYPQLVPPCGVAAMLRTDKAGRRRWQDDWHKGRGGARLKEKERCDLVEEGHVSHTWTETCVT